jgi:hypothetical protein
LSANLLYRCDGSGFYNAFIATSFFKKFKIHHIMSITSAQLKNISDHNLGLRAGTEAKNAAYCMSDFGFDVLKGEGLALMRWLAKPDSDKTKTQAWLDHLYNTIWVIDSLDQHKGFTLLIVTNAKLGGKESYKAPGGHGDKVSFIKTSLPSNAGIVAQATFLSGHIDEAVEWVLKHI